jgi:hypothetical protein
MDRAGASVIVSPLVPEAAGAGSMAAGSVLASVDGSSALAACGSPEFSLLGSWWVVDESDVPAA